MNADLSGSWKIETQNSRPQKVVVEFTEPSDGPWRTSSPWEPVYDQRSALEFEIREAAIYLVTRVTGQEPDDVVIDGHRVDVTFRKEQS